MLGGALFAAAAWAGDGRAIAQTHVLWITPDEVSVPIAPYAQGCWDESEQLDVSAIHRGACEFRPVRSGDLRRGLTPGALWLKLQLGNPQATSLERWLVVGHPQLQQVSAWFEDINANGSAWRGLHTGVSVPISQRPLASLYPVLPMTLSGHSVLTVYIRVASQNALDATTALWQPGVYRTQQGQVSVLHTVATGGMFLAALLGLLLFGLLRERLYLLFGLGMAGEVLLEGCRSGIVALFFWPIDQPFWVGLMSLGSLIGTVFLQLFVLEFAGTTSSRLRWLEKTVIACLLAYSCGVLWALGVNFRSGLAFYIWALQGLMLCGVVLIALRIHAGEKRLWLLIVAFMPTVLVETLRFAAAQGVLHFGASYLLAAPWGLLLLSPLLLLGMTIRSRDLHAKLVMSQVQSQARVDFLAEMSHELRGPLNSVMGYAQLLQRSTATLSVPDAAAGIARSGKRLLRMIDEILDFARGQASRMVLDVAPVHWPSLVADLRVHGQNLAQQHMHAFELEYAGPADFDLLTDERRLRQVLDNLLSNASRYGNGSPVTLRCCLEPLKNGRAWLCFDVSDQGPGIRPEERDRIFEPFVRGSWQARVGHSGLGLGLALSRQIAALMGGTLILLKSSEPGSTFRLTFECRVCQERHVSIPTVKSSHANLSKLRQALVVDDDPDARDVLTHALQSMDFEVQTACDGNEAVNKLHAGLTLVLVDQFMPDGDGWMVLQALRQQLPEVVAVLVSGAPAQPPDGLVATMTFDAFVMKPVDIAALAAVLDQLVGVLWRPATVVDVPHHQTFWQIPLAMAQPAPEHQTSALEEELIQTLQELAQLVAAGALTDILNWASDLEARKPDQKELVHKVREAALALDFAGLKCLVEVAAGTS
jgi:two-component system, sensor histidine kinase LadS